MSPSDVPARPPTERGDPAADGDAASASASTPASALTSAAAEGELRAFAGLVLVDKPEGPTSHDVVQTVRRALGQARCGHAGTLDPFASGLLLVAAGPATRLLRFLSGADKSYEGTIRLGVATDTDDRTGRPLHDPRPPTFSDEALARAVAVQTGAFDQVPPGYSARKQGGVRSYRLARRGREPASRPARVRVDWEECRRVEPGLLRIRVTVASGTYIRAIARDLGEALGCGGHLESLRRTASGPFRLDDAVLVPTDETTARALRGSLIPLEEIPLGLPTARLTAGEARTARTGAAVARKEPVAGAAGFIRLVGPSGELVGVAEAVEAGDSLVLKPRIVL